MSVGQGLTQEQLGLLLRAASMKLGKDPAQLKQELSKGSMDKVLSSIGGDREKLRAMLENRAAMEELLSSAQVQAVLRETLGHQK